jgi:hypothetical protein
MRHPFLSFVVGMAIVAMVACRIDAQHAAAEPPASAGGAALPGSGTVGSTTGKVVETMNAGSYTYVQVDDGSKKIWAAAPQFAVAVGDKVVIPEGMPMQNFESKTLGRTFDLVYFVPGIQVIGGQGAQGAKEQITAAHGAAGHGATGGGAAVALDFSKIQKADGGQTVAELFAKKAALVGKDVVVRGKVAKFTAAVMGKNWIHLQDGTGSTGTNDVTVTTSAAAAVGNTVLVRGKLGTDKDLGAGYRYDVIIEDAAVTVE